MALQKNNWYHEMLCHPGYINILTRNALAQQLTTCVRSAQHTKDPKQVIINMAS